VYAKWQWILAGPCHRLLVSRLAQPLLYPSMTTLKLKRLCVAVVSFLAVSAAFAVGIHSEVPPKVLPDAFDAASSWAAVPRMPRRCLERRRCHRRDGSDCQTSGQGLTRPTLGHWRFASCPRIEAAADVFARAQAAPHPDVGGAKKPRRVLPMPGWVWHRIPCLRKRTEDENLLNQGAKRLPA
jgi:hypothetical protein